MIDEAGLILPSRGQLQRVSRLRCRNAFLKAPRDLQDVRPQILFDLVADDIPRIRSRN
jgi:hypothetical protein